MENQRLFLFIGLSIIVLLLWQAWEKDQHPALLQTTAIATPAPGTAGSEHARDNAASGVPQAPTGANSNAAGNSIVTTNSASDNLTSGKRIDITTDLIHAQIDTVGGDLRALYLLAYPAEAGQPQVPFQLLNDKGSELFIAQSGLIGTNGAYPSHKSEYTADQGQYTLAPGQEQLQVRLHWAQDGLVVDKVFTFHRHSYVIDVSYDIHNQGNQARDAYLYAQLLRTHTAPVGHFKNVAPSYLGGAIYTPEKKYQKISFKDMKETALQREVAGGWVAMIQHYFVGAWISGAQNTDQFYSDVLSGEQYVIGYKNSTPLRLAAGQSGQISTRLYAGPKEQALLKSVAPGLVLTVDFGWLTVIASPLYWLLEHIHAAVGNWGWSVILLTVLLKLVFYPLSATSYRSMAHMRRLQPRMASLKERHGDDRQRMQQAMMELYKTEKINPLGGCLPVVVQIPVFIALYWVLLETVELRQAPFALWIKDLSAPDPYFVLPILMGITMFAQQLLTPAAMDPLQRKVMLAMPLFFTVFFLFFPAGLVLYWTVNNVLSISQQWWITRSIEAKAK